MVGHSCQCNSNNLDETRFQRLSEIIDQYKGQRGALIPVLHKAQQVFGYLPEEVQVKIAEGLEVPISEVYGVVTFYSLFTMVPRGKNVITVCLGTACYVKGAGDIVEAFSRQLGIEVGQTTEDGHFTLETSRCIGACGLAPVLTVNEDVHGRLTADDIPELINKYKQQVGADQVEGAPDKPTEAKLTTEAKRTGSNVTPQEGAVNVKNDPAANPPEEGADTELITETVDRGGEKP